MRHCGTFWSTLGLRIQACWVLRSWLLVPQRYRNGQRMSMMSKLNLRLNSLFLRQDRLRSWTTVNPISSDIIILIKTMGFGILKFNQMLICKASRPEVWGQRQVEVESSVPGTEQSKPRALSPQRMFFNEPVEQHLSSSQNYRHAQKELSCKEDVVCGLNGLQIRAWVSMELGCRGSRSIGRQCSSELHGLELIQVFFGPWI